MATDPNLAEQYLLAVAHYSGQSEALLAACQGTGNTEQIQAAGVYAALAQSSALAAQAAAALSANGK